MAYKEKENPLGAFSICQNFRPHLFSRFFTDSSSTWIETLATHLFLLISALSSGSDEYIRLHGSKGVLHSATTGIRRRDSKNLAPPDEDLQERRSSADNGYGRRPSMVEHMRQSSADNSARRGSVDSDGDGLDEVLPAGAPWEPAFSRTPIDSSPLDWAMVRLLFIKVQFRPFRIASFYTYSFRKGLQSLLIVHCFIIHLI